MKRRQRRPLDTIDVPAGVRCIVLDAVGTIMHPAGSVTGIYRKQGLAHGVDVEEVVIGARFRGALALADWSDPSQSAQVQLWRNVVRQVFPECAASTCELLFESLWNHFGQSAAWELFPEVATCWEDWSAKGWTLAIGSNFDDRIANIISGFEPLRSCRHPYWSSGIGFSKPDRRFFEFIADRLQARGDELLMVGDDFEKDIRGARAAGWHAAHV